MLQQFRRPTSPTLSSPHFLQLRSTGPSGARGNDLALRLLRTSPSARRRQYRDGAYDVIAEFDPDGGAGGTFEYHDDGGPEVALAAAGFDTIDPEVQAVICDATLRVEELDPGGEWDSFDARAQLKVLNMPEDPFLLSPPPRESKSAGAGNRTLGPRRPLVRRGRARRVGNRARTRGSRRGSCTPSSRGSPDGDPDLDGESDGPPPLRGLITAALVGGAA